MEANKMEPLPAADKSCAKATKGRMLRHQDMLNASEEFSCFIETYRNEILPHKTRTIPLLGRKNASKIIHTLLGYEVQASFKRIQCPDLVTARYIRLFSELGFHSIKLPYDPTMTARFIPIFEASLDGIRNHIRERYPQDIHTQNYITRKIYGIIRNRIASL
jgi:hypothetical protein